MAKPIRFESLILHEDEDLLLVNKPAHISSLDQRQGTEPSLLALARTYCETAQLCHRLDKETSGVLVIAKHPEAYRAVSMLFESRNVIKTYHAVVTGQLQVDQKSVQLPLSITRNGLAKIDMKEGKAAHTVFTTVTLFNKHTLVACNPITGRLHQIRIHLASVHFPIVGDVQYGGKPLMLSSLKRNFKTSKFEEEQPFMKRVALHAYQITFTLNEKAYNVIAPYPKDMDVLVKTLEKLDR